MTKKNKIIISISAIALTLVTCLGITYALWTASFTQTTTNNLVAGCFSITFSDGDAINIANAYPITDEVAKTKPSYDVTINNTCSINAKYNVRIEILNTSNMNKNFVKASIDNKNIDILTNFDTTTPKLVNATEAYVIYEGILNAGASKTHQLREWIDYTTTTEVSNNDRLDTRITIDMSATDESEATLNDLILAQYGGAENILETPEDIFDQNSSSQSVATTNLMYKTNDDYGTSYYYRGAKDLLNNNLIFAGFQWKIVRINGDGSIRLIYNGICPNNECSINTIGTETTIGTSAFNTIADENKYVGYMYGDDGSTRAGSIMNTNDSAIKTYLDSWYTNNIENQGTGITNRISDTLFCNDRSISSGTGAGNDTTEYAFGYKWGEGDSGIDFICADKNDRFTVSDTIVGNAALTKPIGLITIDEIMFAGGALKEQVDQVWFYLYLPDIFLMTMTPAWFHIGPYHQGAYLYLYGVSRNYTLVWDPSLAVRPVINLNAGLSVTGTGSATDPFRVA